MGVWVSQIRVTPESPSHLSSLLGKDSTSFDFNGIYPPEGVNQYGEGVLCMGIILVLSRTSLKSAWCLRSLENEAAGRQEVLSLALAACEGFLPRIEEPNKPRLAATLVL